MAAWEIDITPEIAIVNSFRDKPCCISLKKVLDKKAKGKSKQLDAQMDVVVSSTADSYRRTEAALRIVTMITQLNTSDYRRMVEVSKTTKGL